MSWVFEQTDDSNSSSKSFLNNCTNGSVLVASARTSAGTPTGFSDGTNGTWTAYVYGADVDGNHLTVGYFIGNTSTTTETVTLTGSGLGNIYLAIAEYTHGAITVTEQAKNNRDADDNDTSANSNSVTVPSGDMLCLGFCALGSDRTISAGGTVGSGTWTMRNTFGRTCIQDVIDAGAGSAESAPTWTTNAYNQGAIIVLGEATAGGAFPYHSVKQQRKDMKTLLTM